jgi:hypothetical protein
MSFQLQGFISRFLIGKLIIVGFFSSVNAFFENRLMQNIKYGGNFEIEYFLIDSVLS